MSNLKLSDDRISDALQSVQGGRSAFEVIYRTHEHWPLPSVGDVAGDLHVSVLDSSFNPPTRAHLALARTRPSNPISSSNHTVNVKPDYDARLLLLSVRNADKALKPGDATLAQRLHMMSLLAREVEAQHEEQDQTKANVAVAIIDEPTFVAKSFVLQQALREHLRTMNGDHDSTKLVPKLTFVMGFDTLERVLAPRYYPGGTPDTMHSALQSFFAATPDGDGSAVVCAWRGAGKPAPAGSERETETDTKTRETLALAEPYASAGHVTFMELSEWEMLLSSSEVRTECARGSQAWRDMVPQLIAEFIEEHELYIPSR